MSSNQGIGCGLGAGFKQSRKGSVTGNEKRSLRGHRRSIEWRNMRDDVLSLRRNIEVDRVTDDEEPREPSKPVKTDIEKKPTHLQAKDAAKFSNRKEALEQWRKQKELEKLKKKDENKLKKPSFLVRKTSSLPVAKSKTKPTVAPKSKPAPAREVKPPTTTRRVTRASSRQPPPAPSTNSRTNSSKTTPATATKFNVSLPKFNKGTSNPFDLKSKNPPKKFERKPTQTKLDSKAAVRAPAATTTRSRQPSRAAPLVASMGRPTRSTSTSKRAEPQSSRTSTTRARVISTTKTAPAPSRASTRTTRSTSREQPQTKTTRTRSSSATRKPAATPKKTEKTEFPAITPANNRNITKARGEDGDSNVDEVDNSFAPSNFKFIAPDNLAGKSMSFKPLSPKSAASFMFPGESIMSPIISDQISSTPKDLTKKGPMMNSPVSSIASPATLQRKLNKDSAPVLAITRDEVNMDDREVENLTATEKDERCEPQITTPMRRSRRLSSADTETNEDGAGLMKTATHTPRRRSIGRKSSSQDESGSDAELVIPKADKTPRRRSTRGSVSSDDVEMKDSQVELRSEDAKPSECTMEGVESESTQSDSQNSEAESLTEESKKKNPRRLSRRTSRLTSTLSSDLAPVKEVSEPNSPAQGTPKDTQPSSIDLAMKIASLQKEKIHDDAVFLTPGATVRESAKRIRAKSMGSGLSSGKKTPRNNRNSLILRTLSPEEGVEVLKCSPMVEMTRGSRGKTPKNNRTPVSSDNSAIPMLDFGDVDDILSQSFTSDPVNKSQADLDSCLEKLNDAEHNEDKQNVPQVMDVDPLVINGEKEETHDVPYFRRMIQENTTKLTAMCEQWESIKLQDQDLLENKTDVIGQLDTTIGQAQLLMSLKGRFKQFGDLVDDCEFKRGERETTSQDLQGFWDMVFYQIEDVLIKFDQLKILKEKKYVVEKPKVVIKKRIKKPITAKPKGPPVKSKFAAFRAKMTHQPQPSPVKMAVHSPVLPVVLIEPEEEVKTFDAGFFAVCSPVRASPTFHCEDGTPKSLARRSGVTLPVSPGASPLLKDVVRREARKSLHKPSPLRSAPSQIRQKSPLLQDTTHLLSDKDAESQGTPILGRPTRRSSTSLFSPGPPQPVMMDTDSIPFEEPKSRRKSTRRSVANLAKTEALVADKPVDGEHNVAYFREMISTQTASLTSICEVLETIKSEDSEKLAGLSDVSGQIDTTIGQAQLMMSKKGRFKQFEDLVNNCEFGTGEKETTCQDLQGFWDMVFYQIEDVVSKCENLKKLRSDNWIEEKQIVTKPVLKKKASGKPKPKAPIGKSKFAAFRAKMKTQKEDVVPQIPGSPAVVLVEPAEEIKTFNAGFFSVASPVRSPSFHCEGGTPRKSLAKPVTPQGSPLLHAAVTNASRRSTHGPSPLLSDCKPTSSGAEDSSQLTPRGLKRKSVYLMSFDSAASPSSPTKRRRSAVTNVKENMDTSDLFSPTVSTSAMPSRNRRRSSRRISKLVSFVSEPQEIDTNIPAETDEAHNDPFSKLLMPSGPITAGESDIGASEIYFGSPSIINQSGNIFTPPALDHSSSKTPTSAFSRLRVDYTPGVGKPKALSRKSELLFTPPDRTATPDEGEQAVNLMAFSPLGSAENRTQSGQTPSRKSMRRSTRLSLL